ncbi:hypothetical protein LTR93_012056 [Exophiala xenobiotica]|nr:hypothetical protein LTR93_012056 [Exophiala xenobiotica]
MSSIPMRSTTFTTTLQEVLTGEYVKFPQEMFFASCCGFLLLTFSAIHGLSRGQKLKAFPVAGADLGNDEERKNSYRQSPSSFIQENYCKFKDQIFRVVSNEPYIVVPPKYIDEVRPLLNDTKAIVEGIDEMNAAKYSTIYADNQERNQIMKSELTTNLSKVAPEVAEELEFAFATELPPANEWTNITLYPVMMNIVARLASRVFVGPELCRDEEWLRLSTAYTLTSFNSIKAIKKYPSWLRPFMAYLTPEVIEVRKMIRHAQSILDPVIRARKQLESNPGYQKPNDMIQWVYDNMSPKQAANPLFQGHEQLIVAFTAFHTTTSALVQTLYDLVARPEYIEPLRDEIRHVLSANDGRLTNNSMEQLKKLDSFMKESQRFNPIDYAVVRRYATRNIELSDGTLIPPNTYVRFPTTAIHFDPEIIPLPDEFDGFRFSKAREAGGVQGGRYQFASVAKSSMNFGYGKHACPGRFFAAMEIKMILVALLLRYDIRIIGEEGKRYPSLVFDTAVSDAEQGRNPPLSQAPLLTMPTGPA